MYITYKDQNAVCCVCRELYVFWQWVDCTLCQSVGQWATHLVQPMRMSTNVCDWWDSRGAVRSLACDLCVGEWFGTKVALSRMWSRSLSWMVWSMLLWLWVAFRNNAQFAFYIGVFSSPSTYHISITVYSIFTTMGTRGCLLWCVSKRACVSLSRHRFFVFLNEDGCSFCELSLNWSLKKKVVEIFMDSC